jgi:hypothetical protein
MGGKALLQRMGGKATVHVSTDGIMALTHRGDRPDGPAREERVFPHGQGKAKRPPKE